MNSEDRRTAQLVTIKRLAIAQIVLGVLCLINGIAIMAIYQSVVLRLGGAIEIWTELFFIVAGVTGIVARSRGKINVHMAFCIVASVMAFILLVESAYFAAPKRTLYFVSFSGPHIPLTIFALIEFIISIVSASACCRAVCCQSSQSSPGAVVVYPGQQGGPMMIAQHPAHNVAHQGAVTAYPPRYVEKETTVNNYPVVTVG